MRRITAFGLFACALSLYAAESPVFEVASVKPSPPVPPAGGVYFGPARGGPGTADPARITWSYARFIDLLMTAYDAKTYQINGPAWITAERYDVVAKIPEGATREQVQVMWQNLLAERFGLAVHHELKEFNVDELVIAKTGSRLMPTTDDSDPEGPPKIEKNGDLAGPGLVLTIRSASNGLVANAVARAQPLSKLTAMLGNEINRPVLDKTGLAGKYDFKIEFTPHIPRPPGGATANTAQNESASEPGPDLAEAVERQLGLRLVASKATLDVVVVDKVQKVPTAN